MSPPRRPAPLTAAVAGTSTIPPPTTPSGPCCLGTGPDTPDRLRVHITPAGSGVTVLSLDGPVDIATADAFDTALTDIVTAAGDGGRIVLELNRVTFLAARGLGIIAAAHDRARRGGATVVLVADRAAPPAASLRFLLAGECPVTCTTLTAALAAPGAS